MDMKQYTKWLVLKRHIREMKRRIGEYKMALDILDGMIDQENITTIERVIHDIKDRREKKKGEIIELETKLLNA